ncbi:MAG TPA: DUF6049 family protein [Streptosporangiaceae bacterium]|nr:DUF6049 family protein [Streptosporangiaceae bacterium]
MTVPRLWRAGVAAGVIAGVATVPLLAGSAGTAKAAQTVRAESAAPVQLTVLSISPSYAMPGRTIVIKGRLSNNTNTAMTGLGVRLMSSTAALSSTTGLEQFAAGTSTVPQDQLGTTLQVSRLRGRHAKTWTIKLRASGLRVTCFGVYPLTVQVTDASGSAVAGDPIPMPFWPDKAHSCPQTARPDRFPISWVWPLVDIPHAGPCPGLLDNSLAPSLAAGGRLSNLLAAGRQYSTSARLTWAIDPALLDNAATMTEPYPAGSSASCQSGSPRPASQDAKNWLTGVVRATRGQPVFVTPYGDVDVAGLAQYGRLTDLRRSFAMGQRLAGQLLSRGRLPAPLPAGAKQLSAVAWPADGIASPAVLEVLGAMKISTVILAMPPPPPGVTYTPGAVTSTVDGVGTKLKVLLADNSLARLLASRMVASRKAGTISGLSQLFMAETAMIVAEKPAMQRPIMVTPPRRWNPSKSLAEDLLTDTVTAPWLRSSTLSQLSAQPEQKVYRSVLRPHPAAELSGRVLKAIARLDNRVALLKSMMIGRHDRLSHAVYSIESSAWAGQHAHHAHVLLDHMRNFVTSQFAGISVGGQHVIHVTLGGRVGSVTISVHNSLDYPVRVGLRVRSSNNTVIARQHPPHQPYIVPAHSSAPIKLSVNATQTGKATLKLSLRAPTGVLLPNPPDKPLLMEISATNLGTVALVICAAALAVFVVASAAQAIRRGRPGPGQSEKAPDPAGPPGTDPAGTDSPGTGPVRAEAARTGAVETGAVEAGAVEAGDRAVFTSRGPRMPDSPAQPEQPDKFDADRSELSPVGRGPANQPQAQPGQRPTEESQ